MTLKKQTKDVTVAFIALGCPKNIVDSERMLAEIAQAGFLITDQPEDADVVVINTCGFINPAKTEALDEIKQALEYKNNPKHRLKKVIVAGCLPQRYKEKLLYDADGIDAIVGLADRDNIALIIEQTLVSEDRNCYLQECNDFISDDRARLKITPTHYAYLRISQGCSKNCSFCTIPAIRGPFRSKPFELVLAEAAELAASGAAEINVIAQDTTCYGKDLKINNGLSTLLQEIEAINGIKWLRTLYLYPTGINEQLIETIAQSDKILPYFDIPIQHINNKILKSMHRPDTKEQLYYLIENIRSMITDCILRTTLIAGFPGETDEQFEELLEFIQWAKFDALGCFPFYPEENTEAAQMPNQLPENIKQKRMEKIMLTQQKIAFDKNQKRIGSELTCLVDSVNNDGTGYSRFYGQAPDIDSICIIKNCSAKPGAFVKTKVIDTKGYDLIVKQI
jgi:ribosomal protein S12 methylthiotransferase